MANPAVVSVIVPTYNSAKFAVAAVSSVLSQTYPHVEVIVVDDGSTDDTRLQLENLDRRVRYLYQQNSGVSKARNLGISVAKGDFIAFLDADDQWLPPKLEKQVGCLAANPHAGLVHADVLYWHEATGNQLHKKVPRARFTGKCVREFFWNNRIITSTVLVRRTCLEKVGTFDEAVRGPSAEDMDLWIRIASAHEMAYVDEPLALYRVHSGNGSANQKRMAEDEFYVFDKALKNDPTLGPVLGAEKVRSRMSKTAFFAGRANIDAGNFSRARYYFRQALSYSPADPKTCLFLASTLLPPDAWNALRNVKRRIALPMSRTV